MYSKGIAGQIKNRPELSPSDLLKSERSNLQSGMSNNINEILGPCEPEHPFQEESSVVKSLSPSKSQSAQSRNRINRCQSGLAVEKRNRKSASALQSDLIQNYRSENQHASQLSADNRIKQKFQSGRHSAQKSTYSRMTPHKVMSTRYEVQTYLSQTPSQQCIEECCRLDQDQQLKAFENPSGVSGLQP